MIEGYLLERENLAMVFVLVDGEIGPTKLDVQMLEWLRYNGVPHTVVATKMDKVKSSKRATRRKELAAGCLLDLGDIVWVSATQGRRHRHVAIPRPHLDRHRPLALSRNGPDVAVSATSVISGRREG